jgi:hypothetical protein
MKILKPLLISYSFCSYDWKHFRNWGSFEEEAKKKGKSNKLKKQNKYKSNFKRDFDNFFNLLEFDDDDFYSMGMADAWGTEAHEFFWTQVKGRGGWTPPSSPEPEPQVPQKSPKEIAHNKILSKFKTILLDYFMNNKNIVKHLTLFVDSERIKEISDGDFIIEPENDWVYILKSKRKPGQEGFDEEGSHSDIIFGFLIKERPSKPKTLIAGDWHYGAVLQDRVSKDYFAFVFGDSYDQQFGDKHSQDIAARNYVWDVRKLLRD